MRGGKSSLWYRDEGPLTKHREIDYLPDVHSAKNRQTVGEIQRQLMSIRTHSDDCLGYLSVEMACEHKKITEGVVKARGNKQKWEDGEIGCAILQFAKARITLGIGLR